MYGTFWFLYEVYSLCNLYMSIFNLFTLFSCTFWLHVQLHDVYVHLDSCKCCVHVHFVSFVYDIRWAIYRKLVSIFLCGHPMPSLWVSWRLADMKEKSYWPCRQKSQENVEWRIIKRSTPCYSRCYWWQRPNWKLTQAQSFPGNVQNRYFFCFFSKPSVFFWNNFWCSRKPVQNSTSGWFLSLRNSPSF